MEGHRQICGVRERRHRQRDLAAAGRVFAPTLRERCRLGRAVQNVPCRERQGKDTAHLTVHACTERRLRKIQPITTADSLRCNTVSTIGKLVQKASLEPLLNHWISSKSPRWCVGVRG